MVACSEEKQEPLPDLPPVELPKEVMGLYSGSMPCDDCSARMIRMTLKADSSAEVVQTIVGESMKVDSLKGVFTLADSLIKLSLSAGDAGGSLRWNFKRSPSGNLIYLNSAGTVYEDSEGRRSELIRILKAPARQKGEP